MVSVIVVSAWRYTPYFGVVILAARKQVDEQLYEASLIDGANGFQQFWRITLPSVSKVILLTSTLIFVRVVSDFSIVYVLTRGGPSGATQILTVLSFTVAFDVGKMGAGIAVPLSVMPILLPLILVVTGLMVKNQMAAR
jgi:ABC-type sugar transport system permease subunit